MRGVSYPHAWFPHKSRDAFAHIAQLGTNTVRVVLSCGKQWDRTPAVDVHEIIIHCKANRLICMLEVHDTEGFGDCPEAATLDQAVDYWTELSDVLKGEEEYVLINIGNEPWGNKNTAQWSVATSRAVLRMRENGLTHTLVVDAPNYGQDQSKTMKKTATTVFHTDPLQNLVFSVHMYEMYKSAAAVLRYFDAFEEMQLPLIVGEFGEKHHGHKVAVDVILSQAQSRRIGWLAWSWSGNEKGVEHLDLVENFDRTRMTEWGATVFHSEHGIVRTSRRADVFGG